MNAVKFFIDRPIFAGVIWTLLLLVGIVAYFSIQIGRAHV